MLALDSVRDSSALVAELEGATPAGEGVGSPPAWLVQGLEATRRRAGIVRVGDISFLAANGFLVAQATRPALIAHTFLGQNSGGQGRGSTLDHARVAAIMETLEMYCAEPRNASLVRASEAFVREVHPVVPLRAYRRMLNEADPPSSTEPLLWASALSIEHGFDVLAPAESLFYALNARDYDTRPVFPASSNGLAAGPTLVAACLHGLYELVERYYFAAWQSGNRRLRCDRLRTTDLEGMPICRALLDQHPGIAIGVFALRFSHLSANLPNVIAILVDADGEVHSGSACHHDARVAVLKALGEAAQSKSISYSGAREDHAFGAPVAPGCTPSKTDVTSVPETLSLSALQASAPKAGFGTLQAELRALVQRVHELGFPSVLVKNLTRVGLEVPVVRVLVPGMRMQAYCRPRPWSRLEVNRCQYCLDL